MIDTSSRARLGALLLILGASVLHGCTVLTAIETVDRNQTRRAEARTSGPDIAARLPAPGDTVTVGLTDGRTLRDAFVSLSADSLRLGSNRLALADVESVERPWRRDDRLRASLLAFVVDAAIVVFLMDSLSAPTISFNW